MTNVNFIDPQLEQQIQNFALQFLDSGRTDWDIPHTKAVVHYAKQIGATVPVDFLVVVTAAWLHDIGYFGLFKNKSSKNIQNVIDAKKLHMEKGAQMAREFLQREDVASFYTPEQAERVVHLVQVHDKLQQLMNLDEIVLMEADTLGAIDLTKVKPTFDYNSGQQYLKGLYKSRWPKFLTQKGKELFQHLIKKFEEYYKNLAFQE